MENTETLSLIDQPQPDKKSYFDATCLEFIGINLATCFMIIITLYLSFPWAICFSAKWTCSNIVIKGRRLKFTGSGKYLFLHMKFYILIPTISFALLIVSYLLEIAFLFAFLAVVFYFSFLLLAIVIPFKSFQYIVKNTTFEN